MRKLATLLLLIVLPLLAQQAQAPVEITAEPHHHLVLENMFVRVFAFSINPNESTLMHHHGHDYLSVFIGDSQGLNVKEGAQPAPVTFKDGDTRFAATGVNHLVTNTGKTPLRNLTIELLGPTTNQKACTESCAVPVPCDAADKSACVSVNKLITADQWSVTLVTLPAGAKYAQHTHLANFLNVPLADADLTVKVQNQPETAVHNKTGEPTWNNPVIHTVTNTGKTTAKVVVLEFRGRPAGEGSESIAPKDAPKPHDHN